MKKRIIIIGGLSAGPSAAAKARREDENAEIILFEKTANISYATCGIPYALSGQIKDREKLMVVKPDLLRTRFNVDLRLNEAVTYIDTEKQEVHTPKGSYAYDKLVCATGGSPLIPPIKNLDTCDLWSTCKTIEDFDKIIKDEVLSNKESIAIIGAGLIGLEAAENLKMAGKTVHIIELGENVLPILSDTYATLIKNTLLQNDIHLHLNTTATELNLNDSELILSNGKKLKTDYLIIGIGVRPNTALLPSADKLKNGALIVNEKMETSIPNVYAAGDCAAIKNLITNETGFFPMGTHSNKGGRAAGAQASSKNDVTFNGAYGTAIVKLFDITVARTGMVPTKAMVANFPYKTSTVIVGNTPGFYPNPSDVVLTVYYEPKTQVIVGAEAFGKKGIDKRIDVLATAIYAKLTLRDLQNLDLAYAPPFSPAKDPVIVAGYAAENEITGGFKTVSAMDLMTNYNKENDLLIDVRNPDEIKNSGSIPNALNIPLDSLRTRITEIPKGKKIYIYCAKGTRGYLASKILVNNGYEKVHNLMGGFTLWNALDLASEQA
ncbi:FAD-dependent oxidoreductase [Arcticibacterium luteifluviistationis]|uniref:Rhodanese domain-containing protein n=1 Tax=Arcticibacterium luteifluviistationis TaxID=1784714 RepID=A0A2Z4G8E3_9BACT|nr:FAD-dependent oxidoreductase [Arcticibacterium luteifluviistationis]AWV97451.1 hypothetical protein DJ013_04405 [Arcticibacterium luteifluviistationis]